MRGQTDASFVVTRAGGKVTVERLSGTKTWRLLLANVKSVGRVTGGTAETTSEGTLIIPADGNRVKISLS